MEMMNDMKVLLTNDDGFGAPGLQILVEAVTGFACEWMVVAPATNQSGKGQSITLDRPLVVERKDCGFTGYAVDGTPADCVRLALSGYFGVVPDLILSGVNAGANLGGDVYASGTVGAARMGAVHGLAALALSAVAPNWFHVKHLLELHLDELVAMAEQRSGTVVNVNFPAYDGTVRREVQLDSVPVVEHVVAQDRAGRRSTVLLDRTVGVGSEDDSDRRCMEDGYTAVSFLPPFNTSFVTTKVERKRAAL